MTIENINPETLKQNRNQAGLSQQGLADESGVSKKTIARIEAGKSSANSNTVTRLAKALGIRPEDLFGQPDLARSEETKRNKRLYGFSPLRTHIQQNTRLAFEMVEKHYGISPKTQISLAPLFAALLAEGSLAWRRQKLEQAEEAAKTLMDADYGHLLFLVGGGQAEEGAYAERESIEQRDVFGDKVMEYAADRVLGIDPKAVDPFTEYLRYLARQSGSEFIRILPEATKIEDFDERDDWMTTNQFIQSSVYYSIDPAELDRLTGGDRWASMALRRSHVKVADIPQNLLGDDMSEQRIAWLGSKVPRAEIEEAEAEDARLRALATGIKFVGIEESRE